MNEEKHDIQAIFCEALEKGSPEEFREFLDAACGDDAELRAQLEELLESHREAGNFLGGAASVQATQNMATIAEHPGTQIGPYKLREQIGEGGFGTVYVAEQQEPVSRKVALKIIKPGMDTEDVIARFEAERQALAMMDHPNVARVLDAGATESGRPYFVMELVHGLPITEFCDDQKLTNRQRLELFIDVCRAVQHAHQKGIIHRDLKPSNIMVTMHDDKPVPKVIDFGVSKALSHRLTDKTLYTAYGQMVGTPLYMSPEQAQMSGLDVDTRSDVYSLGVLLYELLTGTTPFDKETLKQADFDELRRIIREDEPPRPSERVSTLNVELISTVSDRRKVDRRNLGQSLRGELDWIVMKPLEKDRNRRYESASAFASDIERYLNDEPVLACPPSAWYRLRKFTRKNRTAAAIATMAILLLAAVAVSGIVIAQRAIEQADQQQLTSERRIEANQKLSRALTNFLTVQSRAEQSGFGDEKAWSTAQHAAERVKVLSENQLVDGKLNQDANAALVAFNQSVKDRSIIFALERVRREMDRVDVDDSGNFTGAFRSKRAVPSSGYRAAFAGIGIDADKVPVADAANQVSAQRPEVRDALVVALDLWGKYYRLQPPQWLSESQERQQKWIEQVVDLVDKDEWRRRMRKAIREKDIGALVALAESPDVDQQEADILLLLGGELGTNYVFAIGKQSRPRYAVEFLKKAHRRHPSDYWLVREIISGLSHLSGEGVAAQQVQYAAIAAALRPKEAMDLWGRALLRDQQYEEAAQVYRRLIQDRPAQDSDFHINLCVALEKLGRNKQGAEALASALAVQHDDPRWYDRLGAALRSRNPEQAVIAYQKAVDAAHDLDKSILNRSIWYDLALEKLTNALDDTGQLDQALPLLERRLRESDEVWQHAKRARLLVRLRRWREAADAYQQMLARLDTPQHEGHWRYRARLIRVLAELQLDDQMLECARELVGHIPNRMSLDRKLVIRPDERQAEAKAVRDAFRRLEDTPQAHWALGFLLYQLGDDMGAVDAYRQFLLRDPTSDEALHNVAVSLIRLGREGEAIEALQTALKYAPTNANVRRNLGGILRRRGRAFQRQGTTDAAIDAYKQSIRVRADGGGPHNNLGLLLRAEGEVDEALSSFEKAVRYFTQACKEDPANETLQKNLSVAKNNLARTASDHSWQLSANRNVSTHEQEKALKLARMATGLQPDHPNHWNNLGVALYRSGDWAAAVESLEKADEMLGGEDRAHRFFLAMACWRLGDNEKASRYLVEAVAWLEERKRNDLQYRLRSEAEELMKD